MEQSMVVLFYSVCGIRNFFLGIGFTRNFIRLFWSGFMVVIVRFIIRYWLIKVRFRSVGFSGFGGFSLVEQSVVFLQQWIRKYRTWESRQDQCRVQLSWRSVGWFSFLEVVCCQRKWEIEIVCIRGRGFSRLSAFIICQEIGFSIVGRFREFLVFVSRGFIFQDFYLIFF